MPHAQRDAALTECQNRVTSTSPHAPRHAAGRQEDFLQFLTSPAETAALRGHGFIARADLTRTRRDGACAG
ncbi:hypothetical protein [Streptacidiphilus pinicola]|nr:hypothetical protein [Streptacidiphilus pinicola]